MISVSQALSALKMMGAVDSSRTLVPICQIVWSHCSRWNL